MQLADGSTIPDASALVRHMVLLGRKVYEGYDAAPVERDSVLTLADAGLANNIGARRSPRELELFVNSKSPAMSVGLSLIPADASIEWPQASIPWGGLQALFAAAASPPTPGISLAAASKILHKKRPGIIPILDALVVEYLAETYAASPNDALGLCRAFKREYDHCNQDGALADLRGEMQAIGVVLSPVRVLDKLLWATQVAKATPLGTSLLWP